MSTAPSAGDFVHPALFYGSDEEYLAALVPFVLDGLTAGHPVAVAVPAPRLRVLRTALGDAEKEVMMLDMSVVGRNPGRIIAGVLRRFADAHPDRHVRIIGEPIWAGRTEIEYPACVQHEALINLAFAGRDVTIVCPYDTTGLSDTALADARATHPIVWEPQRRYPSDEYAPDGVLDRYNLPLNGDTDATGCTVATLNDVSPARRHAAAHAQRLGLPDDRVADVELIVTELVTNGVRHTGGSCRLTVWQEAGHLVCEVRDTGHLTDPLAGRRPPNPEQLGGRGLLIVNELADLVRVHTTPHGTTLRVLLRLDHA